MIKMDSDHYYSCQDSSEARNEKKGVMQQQAKRTEQTIVEVVGDVKQFLALVSEKIKGIKELRERQKKQQLSNKLILDQLNRIDKNQPQSSEESYAEFQIVVPQSIYLLEQRLSKIEQKFNNNEIFRQKVQRKGKLAQRIKFLHTKIQTMSNKSSDILVNNIQNYYQNLDEKDENMKALFLYEASTNTKGLGQQIQVLTTYLQNLQQLQSKVKSMPSKSSAVENHQKIISQRKKTSERIQKLYAHMKSQYEKVITEIESI